MQLDYGNPAEGFAGMIADSSQKSVITGVSEEASAALGFGLAVRQGAAEQGMLAISASAQVMKGITVHQHRADTYGLAGAGAIPPKESNPVMTKGRIWVPVENAVTAGLPAFFRHAANGGNTILGKFRSDADSATATAVPTGIFRSSTTGAGVAILEINLP